MPAEKGFSRSFVLKSILYSGRKNAHYVFALQKTEIAYNQIMLNSTLIVWVAQYGQVFPDISNFHYGLAT